MAHYGAQTAKRHYAWSNSPHIKALDKGKLQWKSWQENRKGLHVETVRKYKDKCGKARYHGTKALRGTELLDYTSCTVFLFLALINSRAKFYWVPKHYLEWIWFS